MIARIELEYTAREFLIKPELYDQFEKHLSRIPSREAAVNSYAWDMDQLIDLEVDGSVLMALGIRFVIKSFKGTVPIKQFLPEGQGPVIHVHIPNIGLLLIDEVQVLDDACTDNLQIELDRGWRILCVCPPNGQRRPDYVLGRAKERDA